MTYAQWQEKMKQETCVLVTLTSIGDAWRIATEVTREECAKIAEQAGWDFELERTHGKYIAERIRDGDKPI